MSAHGRCSEKASLMIYFIPDRLIPARFSGVDRRYFNECISIALLLCLGMIWTLAGWDAADGVLPGSWKKIRELLHGGVLMCPLCGGTRSFLFMCRGEIVKAAHYNFFAIVFFFSIFFHFFLKTWVLCAGKLPAVLSAVLKFIDCDLLHIITIFVLWGIQLLLHFTGIFLWYSAV